MANRSCLVLKRPGKEEYVCVYLHDTDGRTLSELKEFYPTHEDVVQLMQKGDRSYVEPGGSYHELRGESVKRRYARSWSEVIDIASSMTANQIFLFHRTRWTMQRA